MNAARSILDRAREYGVEIVPSGDKLKLRAPRRPPDGFLAELSEHKAALLALLSSEPDLPGRARRRLRDACQKLKLPADPILRQFDRWAYPGCDLREMLRWSEETLHAHVSLLSAEVDEDFEP